MQITRPLDRWARRAVRIALSHYVLIGLSAGFGLFTISYFVHALMNPFAAAAAGVGVIAAVPPDQPGPRRGKLRQLIPAAIIGLPLFFAVQVLHDQPIRLGLLIVPASFFAFLGAAWGKCGIPLSMSAMFAIIFSIAVPGRAEGVSATSTTLYFAIGLGSYIVWATLSNIVLNARYRVQLLADTLLQVAALMRTQAAQFTSRGAVDGCAADAPQEPIGRLLREQAALADQLQSARDLLLESPRTPLRQRLAAMLIQVLEMRDHLLACELDADALVGNEEHGPVLATIRRTLESLASEVERIADALLTGRRPVAFASHRATLATLQWAAEPRADAVPRRTAPSPAMLARGLADRVGHIDDEALRVIALARGDAAPDLARVRRTWRMFVSPTTWSWRPLSAAWRWDAPPLRHALRAALAIALGYLLSLALPWDEHPYWVLLTITVVLRGSFAQTIERRNSRVLGTLLGCLIAGGLLTWDETPLMLATIVAIGQGVAQAFAIRRYLIAAIAATVLALTQAHALNVDVAPAFEAFERIADTLIGVGIAWAFSYVLPSWERTQIPVLVRRTLVAHARHARLALGLGQSQVDDEDEVDWRLARREVHDSLSALVQAAQRSLAEPRAVRPPLDELGRLLAHSYQLLAQLTAAKTSLLLRRERLDADLLAFPLQQAIDRIEAALVERGGAGEAAARDVGVEIAAGPGLDDLPALADPLRHDLSPWVLRRLGLAVGLAADVRDDAERILRPGGPVPQPIGDSAPRPRAS